jgi:AmmeMemoRadiSam system protein A/AmmeMemoRadiSam system protein B
LTNQRSLVFSGIAPHPPIMVPEVGRDAIVNVRDSIDAMAELTRRLIDSGAETVILISPHAPLEADSFVAYEGPTLYGDFANFHAPDTEFSASVDGELLKAITQTAAGANYRVSMVLDDLLDHGTAVPLYFLLSNGWNGQIVALGYSFLSNDDHLRFGSCITKAVDQIGRRVAFIASGDLSHRLKPEAPAGYNPSAHVFDEEVVGALQANEPSRIVGINHELRKLAGECGYRSMLVAIGAASGLPLSCEVMNYEAPFGVGYLVAQLTNVAAESENAEDLAPEEVAPGLARRAVETFIREGEMLDPPATRSGLLAARAPCFICLKTRDGELRGCIGTIEAVKDSLAEEIISNAVSAALNDPRFDPVRENELADLVYSVDVLLPPEPAVIEDLDPKVYGVIVEDESESRRGLLLPDIPGVDTAAQQVEIATRKAGIPHGTPVKLSRFKVERFGERTA